MFIKSFSFDLHFVDDKTLKVGTLLAYMYSYIRVCDVMGFVRMSILRYNTDLLGRVGTLLLRIASHSDCQGLVAFILQKKKTYFPTEYAQNIF